jgi:hypothetical protein
VLFFQKYEQPNLNNTKRGEVFNKLLFPQGGEVMGA